MDLANIDALYANAEVPKTDREEVPDGKYQASVHHAEFKVAKTGNPMLALQFKIMAGPHAGRIVFKNLVITEKTVGFLKQDLGMLGWDKAPSALQDPLALRALLDIQVEIARVTRGADQQGRPNVNVYINRRISTGAAAGAQAPVSADNPPF